MQDFIQAIADEHVYLFDGAMGTMLYSKGVFINKCYDELNLRSPEIVLEVHKQYVRSGAEVLETNTYGANRVKLRTFGIEDDTREINVKAVEIARKAAGDSVYFPADEPHSYANRGDEPCSYHVAALVMRSRLTHPITSS